MGIKQIEKTPIFVALIAGIVAITSINNVSRLLGVWNGYGLYVVAFVIFVLMGLALAHFASQPQRKIVFIACSYLGIVVGVIIDVTLDFYLRHYDRNLFPLEIIMWWIFAPIPLLAGIITIQRKKRK